MYIYLYIFSNQSIENFCKCIYDLICKILFFLFILTGFILGTLCFKINSSSSGVTKKLQNFILETNFC